MQLILLYPLAKTSVCSNFFNDSYFKQFLRLFPVPDGTR